MIDLHTHILPNIDDGSQSVEESCKLLAGLEEQGVEDVVFTPHYYGVRHGTETFLKNREAAFARLKENYDGAANLYLGCECNIAKCMNVNFDDLIPLSINGTKYILTEMSFEPEWSEDMWVRLDRLFGAGLIPVIAHVELYPYIRRNPFFVSRLISFGCVIQINCDSVVADDPLVKALIAHGQAHCLGSDTHNVTVRPPKYAAAAKLISDEFGTDVLEGMQKNMRGIIDGEDLLLDVGEPVKRSLFGKYK